MSQLESFDQPTVGRVCKMFRIFTKRKKNAKYLYEVDGSGGPSYIQQNHFALFAEAALNFRTHFIDFEQYDQNLRDLVSGWSLNTIIGVKICKN